MLSIIKKIGRKILGPEGVLLTHRLRGRLAAALYGYPGRQLKVIGVTGTNGKTTTCFMIAEILEKAGAKVGLATTVEFRVAGDRRVNTTKMTTISPFALQHLLKQMVGAGCHYAILEVTSHAIKQERIFGIPFDTVVFTNLTHDHLDYHQSFEEYRSAKLKLFAGLPGQGHPRAAVINIDDKSAAHFLQYPAERQLTYGLKTGDLYAANIRYGTERTDFNIVTKEGESAEVHLPLPGRFNVYNALASASCTIANRVTLQDAAAALTEFKGVPGRMEKISVGQPFTVLVDYAHTPDAFQQIYATLKIAGGRIIHVFGATGDRDKTKRPLLGALAAQNADDVILTDEDPYSEDPQAIIEAVAAGVQRAGRSEGDRKKEGLNYWKILDRRQAIAKAFSLARRGDIVLITGKGAEQAMVVGDRKLPWDDRQVAREELAKSDVHP